MRIWYPKTSDSSKSKRSYIFRCNVKLEVFKRILRKNMNIPKLDVRRDYLLNCELIEWTNTFNMSVVQIVNTYINKLYCVYDANELKCYYTIPKGTKCPFSNTELDYVIRLLEYGNNELPPLNWIRHSYKQFIESIK